MEAINTYIDTRGATDGSYTFTQAVIEGLAPGGGLFVPNELPHFSVDEICALAQLPYAAQAATIYKRFGIDLPDGKIDELMAGAYGANFDTPEICPIRELEPGMHVLELWHGPTGAFKDMALQCLPRFFSASIDAQRAQGASKDDYLILTATSGDTGKAALEGFRDREHISIIVFYPHGGVSDIQYLQMATQRGGNVAVYAARGNFDDCQTSVKAAFDDDAFSAKLSHSNGIKLSSANSINWGRLLPQVCYYISSYARMVASGAVGHGAPIDICVPTGNFGNILAAYYAREMGTPIERLLCASNENRVLTDFIETGVYDISDRPFVLTASPSMDILVSSNLERQLFELCGRDAGRIATWMSDLKASRRFEVDSATLAGLQDLYRAASVDDARCFETIRSVYEAHGYLLDPHSAVAYTAAGMLAEDRPVLIASTAHWAKFGTDVYRAISGIKPHGELPDEIGALSGIELDNLIAASTGASPVPAALAELPSLPVRFNEVIDSSVAGIQGAVGSFLS